GSGAPLWLDTELVTPGLVDAHTHAVWAGSRHHEYAQKLAGEGYEAIAKAGGGIRSTMAAVRAASDDELTAIARARLGRMAAGGVTTVEVKSGYGLSPAHERRQLEAVARLATEAAMPRLVPTFLALHAIAPEHDGRRGDHIAAMHEALAGVARDGLARFVDAYVDRAAFSVAEAEPLLAAARALGLGVRLHAGQFADVGGAELAARLGAASADHLEQVSPAGIEAMARAGVAAVLLPVACFTLGQAPPPVAALRAAGVSLVVASDANPGTAPTESLPLALAFAARLYGLTPSECLLGATRHAARSLGLAGVAGVLAPGASADLVAWGLPHEEALVQPWGRPPVTAVVARGQLVAG
ncbi:MAG: imidazolonepropionase, partial [Myxococcales bacterium]